MLLKPQLDKVATIYITIYMREKKLLLHANWLSGHCYSILCVIAPVLVGTVVTCVCVWGGGGGGGGGGGWGGKGGGRG